MDKDPKLNRYSGRELLELIIANQTNLTQLVLKMNTFFSQHYGQDYTGRADQQFLAVDKMQNDLDDQ